jgi:hypothetical protein
MAGTRSGWPAVAAMFIESPTPGRISGVKGLLLAQHANPMICRPKAAAQFNVLAATCHDRTVRIQQFKRMTLSAEASGPHDSYTP